MHACENIGERKRYREGGEDEREREREREGEREGVREEEGGTMNLMKLMSQFLLEGW